MGSFSLPKYLDDSKCEQAQWLVVNLVFSVLHVAAAFYFGKMVSKRGEPTASSQNSSPPSVFGRASHLICYDPWIAAYIVVLIAFICWLFLGFVRLIQSANCEDILQIWLGLSIACGFIFLCNGIISFIASFCCASCIPAENQNNPNWSISQPTPDPPMAVAVPIEDTKASASMPPPTAPTAESLKASAPMAESLKPVTY